MNTRVFIITAKTNIHVGNENGNEFTIIDKSIQRDPLTNLPCINSSSLKGAINEYCTHGAKLKSEVRTRLFGSDKTGKTDAFQKGEAIFFDAKLLYLPQQDNQNFYHLVTSKSALQMMKERVRLFIPEFDFSTEGVNCISDEELLTACDNDNLPIIARNTLENGESKNLWYEQVLPAETKFYTIIREEGDDLLETLDGKIIQIGANATIGYGYCKFEIIR